MTRSRSFALLGVFIIAGPLSGQQPSETVTVEVTNVDAVVADGRGNRVTTLGTDDFEILVDGRSVPVTNVEAVTSPQQARAAHIVLLFDQASLSITSRKPAVAATRQFVAQHLRPSDRVMVATMTRSLTPRLPWTSDRQAIEKTLAEVERDALMPRLESERRRVETQIRNAVNAERTSSFGGTTTFEQLTAAARSYATSAARETNQTIAAIGGTVGAFRPGPERKILVLIGEGLPLNPGADIFEYLRGVQSNEEMGALPQAIRRGARTASPTAEAATFDVSANVRRLAAAARERGVVVYAFAPALDGGNETPVERTGISAAGVTFAATTAMMGGYQLLANTTGGLAMIGTPAGEAMTQIASDLTSYYSIGYRGAPPKDASTLVVKAKGNYQTRAALAGQPLTAEALVEQSVLSQHGAAVEANELGIELQGSVTPAGGNKRQVALKILIPVRSLQLQNAGGQLTGGFTVFISTGDGKGDASAITRQTHEIRWPADALPQLIDRKMTFAVGVELTPPRTQVSVGVMDRLSQKTGYAKWSAGN